MKIYNKFENALQNTFIKKIIISLIIGICIMGYFEEYTLAEKNDIASKVLRLHCIANSDEEYDQALKLNIRDTVLSYIGDNLKNDANLEETNEFIRNNLKKIEAVAKEEIINEGYSYPVKCYIGKFDFPTKSYGDISLPKGTYNALRIVIGKGEGHNWWCVIYPKLCITDDGRTKLKVESKKKLKKVLTENEYKTINYSKTNKVKYKLKFKCMEWFK